MITKFDSLFAGHVDMDNVGYGGVPVNERRLPDEHLTTVFDKAEAMAKLMDRVGYDTFWMAEHHFQREGMECIPNVLMAALHLAHVTKNIKLGCGFNITPMWHPLRLAEDYATADLLTKGRTVFGVGRGYHSREVETFGNPIIDQEANRELFEEGVDILFKAFEGKPFSHKGKYYTIPPKVPYRGYTLKKITLVPAPERLPVECWQPIVSASKRGIEFMVRHGIKGLVGGGAAIMAEGPIQAYQRVANDMGHDLKLGENLTIGVAFYLAKTREQAVRELKPLYEEHVKMFGELRLVRALTDEQIAAMRDPRLAATTKLPRVEDAVKAGGFLTGTPADIIEQLKAVEKRYPGVDRVVCATPLGTPLEVQLEDLDRFAKEVTPAFRLRCTTPPLRRSWPGGRRA